MNTDLILFDVDGTLLDSGNIILGAQERTATELGLVHPGREAGFAIVGMSLDLALVKLFGDALPVTVLSDTYKRIFNTMRGSAGFEEPLFDGVPGVLARLSSWDNTKLGIATGKTKRGLDHVVEMYGWQDVFVTFQTADSAPSKPDPGMIHQAIEAAGSVPHRTVMIGDSVHDMRMAKAAGATAIAVSWGFQPPAMLIEAGADIVARTVADLPALIATSLRRPLRVAS
jgi:phosphoglycolate phosphatase